MNRVLLPLYICLVASLPVIAQNKVKQESVPGTARAAFAKAFPDASKIKWEKENKDYEVNFVQKAKEMSAVYDANGQLKETEVAINITQLPKQAAEYVKTHYKGASIKDAAKITKTGGEVNYEAEVNHKDVIFDATGKFLREEKD